jgi:ubiquinone biosynthesis protein UbiJ
MQDSATRTTRSRLAFGASPRERVGAIWRRNGALAFFLGLEILCAPALSLAQAIKTDGRTATTVTTVGTVTKVTTATVTNTNAFNSFQTFGVAAGTTTNLYVPSGAANLINIVRDQRTDIYGVLNAIKDGSIGGNVWFANPYGFVVGASGVVNVGSLNVSTPTPAFIDSFFLSPGSPNQGAVTQLLNGTAPRNASGVIAIDGRVNAANGVSLSTGSLSVGGSIFSGARFVSSTPDFTDVVNANGIVSANNAVMKEGRIIIVADNDVTVSGAIAAPGGAGVSGGNISITAGHDVNVQPGALISAQGNGANSAGGSISVFGGNNATFGGGAAINASAGSSGDGGAIEFSAVNTVTLAGGTFAAGAASGRAGSVLVDPNNVEVVANNQILSGTNYALVANNSITVNNGVIISTRNIGAGTNYDTDSSAGNSGDISLAAPSITLNPGSKLLAQADGGFTGGAVTLTATQASGGTAQINLSQATVKGKSVSMQASSTLTSTLSSVTDALVLSGINSSDATASIVVDSSQIAASGGALTLGSVASVNVSATSASIPLAILRVNSNASVDVKGSSSLTTTTGDAHLTASSTVTTSATPSSAFANLAGDGMVAVSAVASNATVHIGDAVNPVAINIGGLLDLSATNTVTTMQIANATAAGGSAAGASVAVSTITGMTSATVDGNTTVGAGSLNLSALTTNTVTATAKSAAQGAQQDSSGASESSQTLTKYSDDTSTGDSGSGGGVKVAGAVAVSDLQSNTQTSISSTHLATVSGAATLTSRATNSAAVSADGSATSGSTGVGVAVAVNVAKSANQAYIGQNLNAQSLAVTAGMNPGGATNQFTTSAVSGAGASNVGIAGSIAVNALDLSSLAAINSGNTVALGGGTGAVTLSAENLTSSSASSTPAAGGASGSKVGIGASVAVNVVSNRSVAQLSDSAVLTGAGDLTIRASGADAVTTTAEAGSSGGTAITPVAAINVINNTTTASIGSGSTLILTGDLLVQADQAASASATAKGSTQGASAAIGAAVAVALVDDEVTATTARWIDTSAATVPGKGNVSFLAHGASASATSATASAVGGKSDDQSSSDDGDVDTKVGKQLNAGTSVKSKNGVGDAGEQSKDSGAAAGKPSASSSEGKISVAAAVAVNLQTSSATATVPDGGKVIAAGAVKLSASNNTDGSALTDGSAVGSTTTVGIGAGISINLVKSANEASIGQNATVTANGLTLEALMTPIAVSGGTDQTNTLDAEAKSGAGGSKVGLAGSLALNIADTSSQALIKTGASVNANGGDVVLSADDRTSTTGKALPADGGGASGGKVGIGASVAVNVVANRSTAEIQDSAALNNPGNVTLQANGVFDMLTQTEAGSQGGVSITPSVAISLANNSTTAQIGSGAALTLTGDLLVQADQTSTTSTIAKGSSQGAKAAIGAAVAVALVDDEVTATTARSITANGSGNVSFLAHGASASSASATASAVGGNTDDSAGTTDPATGKEKEDASVDDKVSKQADFGKKEQTDNNVGDAKQKSDTSSADADKPSASSSEGKISVAAAVSVNLQTSSATATVPDNGSITAAGTLKLSSSNNTDGTALTDGSAVGSTTTVGIGAGISINLVKSANEASIGQGAVVSAHGVTLEALMTALPVSGGGTDQTNTLDAEAKSGAGGTKVGLAGSLALNIADTSSQALIKTGASVNANGGDVVLSADDRTSTTGKALPADGGGASGGKVGIGASVAVNVVANRSTAEIQDNAALTNAGSLTLQASGAFDMLTQTEAGSQGGISITPSVAISLSDNSTTASIGTSTTALTLTGDLLVQADQTSSTSTIAKGSSQGAKAAIGAAVAVALVDDEVTATTARAIVTTGTAPGTTGVVSFLAHGASSSSASATASAVGGNTDDDAGKTDPNTGKEKEDASVDDKVQKQADFGKTTQADNNVGDSKQKASTADSADNNKASASSSEGKISVAAAVAVNLQTSSATATVPDNGNINAAGLLKLSSSNNTDGAALSDGSAVGSTTTLGIGAGVSVNLVKSVNEASIGAGATVNANGVTLEALMTATPVSGGGTDQTNTLDAEAKSGAGGTKVGLAGSLALNIADTSSQALIKTGTALAPTTVNARGGDVSLSADDQTSTTGKALPADGGGATGGKVGIGASVTVNIVANRSIAEIQDSATLTNPGAVGLAASGTYSVDTEAEAGAAGGVAITPVLALALINNTTSARLGIGSDLVHPGAVTITADHASATTTSAKGSTQGDKAAVGAAVGIVLLNDVASATTDRNILNATGDVTISAHASSASTNSAIASAVGGKSTDDAGTTDPATGKPSEDSTVDGKVDNQLTYGKNTQTANNVGDADQKSSTSSAASNKPSAKSDEGQVAVAAAVAVNIVSASATATIADNRTVTTSGALKLSATGNTDGIATSDGSVVGKTQKVGIGAAVSVNKVDSHNEASIGSNASVTAHGVTIEALMTNVGGDTTNTLDAEASSGAGGSKVGIAASLALNIADTSGEALVKSGASVNAGGNVSLTSQDFSSYTAKAVPTTTGGASGGSVGVGASVALNLISSASQAQIGTNAGVSNAGNITLSATTKGDSDAEATAGASGGKLAFDAAVAVTTLNQTTDASIASGGDIVATGSVGLTSTSSGAHTATTTGVAKSGSVAIGASVGVITSTSTTTATIDRNVSAGGSFTLAASSTRSYDAGATATAGGSQSDSTYSDSSNQSQEGGAASTQALSKQNSSTNQGTQGGGKVAVAAAVSVIVIDDDATAQVTGGRTIQAGSASAVQVTAANLTNFSARGEGDAVNPQAKVGVGVGVGIVIANNDTTAALADNTHLVQGGNVTVQATSKENTDPSFSDKLSAEGIAGAGGSKVGVAGAFAVVDSNTTTQATIGTGSTLGGLDSHSVLQRVGTVTIDAENTSMLAAKAWSGALGGTAGVGASVATVISDNSYMAELGGSSNVTATSLSITAQNNKVTPAPLSLPSISVSSIDDVKDIPSQLAHGNTLLGGGNYYTEAIAGSAGGTGAVAGSFAVSVFTDKTDASIGGGATVNATGGVTLTSGNDTVARSLAGGVSLGGDAGVGISSADVASTNVTRSHIDADTKITQSASIGLSATNKQDIQVIGFAAAGSGSVGVGGVANVITLNNTAEAFVANSALPTPLTLLSSTGALTLGATNTVTGLNIASGIAVGGSAGVGVAGAVNTIGTDSGHQFVTHAYIGSGATVNVAGATTLTASAAEDLTTFAIGGAAGGSAGVGGAAIVNVMNTDTDAYIGANAKVNKAQTLTNQSVGVQATDATSLFNVVGAAGVGGSAGVGASVDVDVITKNTQAYVGNGAWVETAGNLTVQAASSEDLRSIALGFGAGGSAGVAGSVAVYSLTTTTKGYLDDNSTLRAKGSALISADDTTSLDLIAGSAAGGGSAAVGAGVGVTVFSKTTQAYVGNNADVVALGNGSAVTAATGDFNVSTGSTISGDGEVSDSGVTATDPNNNNLTGSRSAFTYLTKQRVSTPVTSSVNGLAVAATNRDKVESFTVTGAAAGAAAVTIGGSVAVVTTDTEASIGSGTQVNQATIAGSSASGAQSVRVAAGDDQFHVGLGGAAAGAGAAAVGAGADVLVAGNTTKATIGANAQVKAKRDVEVLARGQEQYLEMGAGLAAAGTVAIAGSVGVISLNDKTYASIVGGTTRVDAGGNVRVAASDNTETDMIAGAAAAGFGAAGVGIAVGVNSLTKDTQATVGDGTTVNALGGSGASALTAYTGDDTDTTATMHGLQVQATSKEDLFLVTASGAAGLYAGVSGAVTVTVVNSNTLASIGNTALINTTNGGAAADQDVNVSARNQLNSQTFVGSVGIGAAGVAGGVDVLTAKNNTTASIGTGTEVHAARDVDVNALSKNQLSTLVVSAGGGVVGVAGGVAVYSIGDKLSSDSQDQLTSNGDVKGQADSQASDGTLNSLLSQSSDQNVKNVSASAQSKRSAISTSGAVTSGPAATGNSASIGSGAKVFAGGDVSVNSRGTMNFSQTTGAVAVGLVGLGAGIGIANFNLNNQASIGANAEITAGDDLKVRASLNETANGLAFAGSGGVVAVNAALAMLSDNSTTTAAIGNGVEVHHADQVDVEAGDVRKLDTQALGASIGAVAGGASVATTSIGGTTSATIGSGIAIGAGVDVVNSLFVSANSSANAASGSIAAAGGIGLALSGSGATASSTPTVSASVGGGTVNLTGDATVQATGRAGASADAEGFNISLAVSAGGSVAIATSAPQISASLGTGTTLTADNLTVSAAQLLPTSLDVFSVNSGNVFTPGTVSGVSTLATATGASAALFAGVTATSADAANNGHVTSSIGDGSTLTVPGLLSVGAENDSNQSATVSGLSAGIVAIGSNNSSATSNTLTHATLGNNVNIAGSFTGGSVSILATGTDTNIASAVSGSGGIVSGAAASANTSEISDTLAQVGSSTCGAPTATCGIASGSFGLVAQHDSIYNAKVDSTSAAVAGASGATTSHLVQSTVNANIGNNTNLSANNIAIAANNASHKFWWGLNTDDDSTATADNAAWNVNSGSGGLISLPAGSTSDQIFQLTGVSIGQGAYLHVMMPVSGTGSFSIDANNTIVAYDKTKLDSGGAIAIAESDSVIDVKQSVTNVTIGANAAIVSDSGNVNIGTRADVKLDARATANAYGLAGAPSGVGDAIYNGSSTVHLNDGVVILAQDPNNGAINIAAGQDSQQRPTSIIADASVNLWNKTVIPIDSDPDPHSTVVSNATLQLDGSSPTTQSLLLAAGDIGLAANKGVISQKADGVGKDLYKEAIAAIANAVGVDVSLDLTGGTTSLQGQGTVLANGTALSGLYRESATLLDGAPVTPGEPSGWILSSSAYQDPNYRNPNPLDTTHPFAYITFVTPTAVNVPFGSQLQDQINKLNSLAAQYSADPVATAAYNSEITFLQSKLNSLGAGQNSSTLTDRAIKTAMFAGDATAVLNNYQYAITGDIGASAAADQIGAVGAILNAYGTIKANNTTIDGQLQAELNSPKDTHGAFLAPTTGDYATLATDLSNAASKITTIKTQVGNIGNLTFAYAAGGATPSGPLGAYTATTVSGVSTVAGSGYLGTIQTDMQNIGSILFGGNTASNGSVLVAKVNDIKTQMGSIATANQSISSAIYSSTTPASTNTLYGALIDAGTRQANLRDAWKDTATSGNVDTSKVSTITGLIGTNSAALADFNGGTSTTSAGIISTNASGFSSCVTTSTCALLVSGTTTAATINLAADQSAVQGGSDTVSQQQQRVATLPNISVKLGNVNVNADVLTGSGSLQAPGDAKILIKNFSPASMNIGQLTVDDTGGNVTFNSYHVNSSGDVQAVNAGGAGDSLNIVSRANGLAGLDRVPGTAGTSVVQINSFYDPAQFSKTAATTAEQIPAPAPEIHITNQISNPNGSVTVTSAAGDIFVDPAVPGTSPGGSITAGQVSIVAQNGDFVQAFQNGFDSIAGEPINNVQGGSNNTSPGGTLTPGNGILANGNIFISARYLNINGLVQSGIANYHLNLGADTDLRFVVNGTPNGFSNTLRTSCPALTACTSTSGSFVATWDGAYKGIDGTIGRWEVNKAYVDANFSAGSSVQVAVENSGGAGVSAPSSPDYGAIAANYIVPASGQTGQIVLSTSTAVHGGSINLFGQIINTAPGGSLGTGQLNVLDGFGQIAITNNSSLPITLKTLDTGADPSGTGRGTAGVININDVQFVDTSNVVHYVDTTITRNNGAITYTQTGEWQSNGAFCDLCVVTQASGATAGVSVNGTGSAVGISSARSGTYDPQAGLRYAFTTGNTTSTVYQWSYSGHEFFGSSSLALPPDRTSMSQVGPPNVQNTNFGQSGVYLSYATPSGFFAHQNNLVTDPGFNPSNPNPNISLPSGTTSTGPTQTGGTTGRVLSSSVTFTNSDTWHLLSQSSSCDWWLCITSTYTSNWQETVGTATVVTNSVKADNPIQINFIGQDVPSISVKSKASVVLAGTINDRGGATTITAGVSTSATAANGAAVNIGSLAGQSITYASGTAAPITAGAVTLSASGSVGAVNFTNAPGTAASVGAITTTAPILLAMTPEITVTNGVISTTASSLNASSGTGNVVINQIAAPLTVAGGVTQTAGTLAVGTISAGGQPEQGTGYVLLQSQGDIAAASPSSFIRGERIELTSANGSIGVYGGGGVTAAPLTIQPGYNTGASTQPYYGLKVSAQRDINIAAQSNGGDNTAGNLLVDTVVGGGNVRLAAPGQIIDNNPIQSIDTRTWNQLVNFWDSLGLVGGTAQNAANQAKAIQAYDNSVTQDYQVYWQIRSRQPDGGAVFDPNFHYTVTSSERAALTAQGLSASDISNFETNRTAQYQQLNTEVGGFTTAFQHGFAYDAVSRGDPQVALILQGSSWTATELGVSIPGALKNITNTNPVIKDPNVQGRNVTLQAGVSIGQTQAPLSIPIAAFSNPDPNNCAAGPCLSDADKVALASAEFDDLTITAGGISVLQRKPVNFSASTSLSIAVTGTTPGNLDNGNAYLASLGDGLLNSIQALGEVRVKVGGSIINAGTGPGVTPGLLQSGGLILEAAGGGIGFVPNFNGGSTPLVQPLLINLNPGAAFTARAADNISVVQTGNLNVESVFSRQDVALTASGSITDAVTETLPTLKILSDSLTLTALNGSIGSPANPLDVAVGPTGTITASATSTTPLLGGVYLNNPIGPINGNFTIASVTASDAVKLSSDLDMKIDGPVTSPGTIGLVSGGTMTLTQNANVHATVLATSLNAGELVMDAGAKVAVDIGNLNVNSGSTLTMADGATMTVNQGTINITSVGDAVVTGIFTGNPTASAINITSTAGHILAGHTLGSGHLDIVADTAPGAKLTMSAALGIGDEPLNVQLLNLQAASGGVVDVTVQNNPATPVNNVDVSAADRVLLTSNVSISGGTVASTGTGTNPDNTVTVSSTAGNVNLASVTGQTNVMVTGQTGVTLNSASSTGGGVTATATTGNVNVTTASAGQGATFTAPAGTVNVTTGTAGADIALNASGNVSGGTLTSTNGNVNANSSAGNVDLGTTNAGQSVNFSAPAGTANATTTVAGTTINGSSGLGITIGSATSGGNTTLNTGGNLAANTLTSTGGSVAGNAAGDATVATGSASGGFTLTSATGNVDVNTATANAVTLSAPGNVTGGTLNVGSNVQLSGDAVTANVNGGGPVIGGSVTGFNGGIASNVDLTLSNPGGFHLDSFTTATGSVNVPSGFLNIDSVVIVDRAVFTNPSTALLVDQHDRSIQQTDVQIYTGGAPFSLGLVQNHVDTSAFVIFRDPAFEVVTPLGTNTSSTEQASDTLTRIDAGRPAPERLPFDELGDAVSYTGSPVSVDGECKPEADPGCVK